MRLPWLIVLVLTGCAVPPPPDDGPYHITNYAPSPLAPNNCGTPYKFRLCITSRPRRPQVFIEQLDVRPGGIAVGGIPTSIGNNP